MNDSELNELLQRGHVPERSADEWKEFAGDTVRQASRGAVIVPDRDPQSGAARRRPAVRPWAWALGFAISCVLFGFLLGHWQARRETARNEIADARKLFVELSAMFPNQLEAVILDGSSPRLVLAEKSLPNPGAPLFVRICGPRGCQRIITFSGQRWQVNGETCEVLVDAGGSVIVTGETFAWSSADVTSHAGRYRIQATPLTGVL